MTKPATTRINKPLAAILLLTALFAAAHAHAQITGTATVTDGDTLRINDTRIRLHGIDAPEAAQTCIVEDTVWHCGGEAALALAHLVADHTITCHQRDIDRYQRIIAECFAGSINLNATMVRHGWALAYRYFSLDYIADETLARRDGAGLWRGEFIRPWNWRRGKRL